MTLPPQRTDIFGRLAENAACEILKRAGYKILERNFRSRFGELDIVAQEGDTLVFVEVKARTNFKFGLPQEAVTAPKLSKIKRTGEYYSLTRPDLPKKLRIDVVALVVERGKILKSQIIKVD